MQAAIRTLFEQELAQVGRRDEVVRLRLVATAVAVVTLPIAAIVIAGLSLLADTERTAVGAVNVGPTHLFADLATVYV